MLKRSMVEVAFEILSNLNGQIEFKNLWNRVSDELGLSEAENDNYISNFYTQLSIDERFVLLEDNNWDLRANHKFEKVHIDMNDAYSELEEEEKELEEEEEEYDEIPFEDDEDNSKLKVDEEEEEDY